MISIIFQNNQKMSEDKSREKFMQILHRSVQDGIYEKALRRGMHDYQLKPYNIMSLTPPKVLQIYRTIQSRFYNAEGGSKFETWFENQLKIFLWTLVVFSYLEKQRIQQMNQSHWSMFSVIFNRKNPDYFQFQSLCLLKNRKAKKWCQEQKKLFVSIIAQKQEKNRWNQIARQIFFQSQKRYFRTPKQCREQWLNHLDPSKTKREWTLFQDYEMIQSVLLHGKKWSKVAKQIGDQRTQHMVKNRYKSLINHQLKKLESESKEEVVVLKIKQRLESNQGIKKMLRKNQLKSGSFTLRKKKLTEKQKSAEVTVGNEHSLQIQPNLCQMQQIKGHVEREQVVHNQDASFLIAKSVSNVNEWVWNDELQIDDLHLSQFFQEKELQKEVDEISLFFQ